MSSCSCDIVINHHGDIFRIYIIIQYNADIDNIMTVLVSVLLCYVIKSLD